MGNDDNRPLQFSRPSTDNAAPGATGQSPVTVEDYEAWKQRERLAELRDQFAMAALPAVLADVTDGYTKMHSREAVADEAYKLADAMLKAREVK